MRTDQALAAYIGLDWGDQRHAVQIQAAAGAPVDQSELEQRPHVLHGWVAQLRDRFGGRPVGIAIEQRRGAVVHALMQYEFLVLYPVNPKALARYRQAFHPSGAKDDPTDAALLLDLLRKHRDQLRPWRPDTVMAPVSAAHGGSAARVSGHRPAAKRMPEATGFAPTSTTVPGGRPLPSADDRKARTVDDQMKALVLRNVTQ